MKTVGMKGSFRWMRAFVGVVLIGLGSMISARAESRWATLEAIHTIENPHNSTRMGPHGELGAYQFREGTWHMYTTIPFSRALDRKTSDQVAVKHYEWIKHQLEVAGVPGSAYNIALAWNGGLDAVVNGHSPRVSHDYAERVVNLATTYDRRSLVAAQ